MLKAMMAGAAAVSLMTAGVQDAIAENMIRLAGRPGEPALLVRHQPGPGPSVLFVHGATFPSGLSVAYKIDGRSWMDDLRDRGFDVWAFDFAGYGGSDRPPAMQEEGDQAPPVGRAQDAAAQIERVAKHALDLRCRTRLALIAHSWGTIPAAIFAGQRPELVDRLVLFGPVALRKSSSGNAPAGGSYSVSAADQWRSFQAGLPEGQSSLVAPALFETWARAYLASDPGSETRTPPSVRVPTGPQHDLVQAWSGRFVYDPATVRAKTMIVRGEWDHITRDADAAWLVDALSQVLGGAQDVKLPRGGHRMHLEENRQALFDAVGAFLGELNGNAGR